MTITSSQILKEINETFSENFEKMSEKERLIVIKNVLSQKLAFEIAEKEYYKSCWNAAMKSSIYKGINS